MSLNSVSLPLWLFVDVLGLTSFATREQESEVTKGARRRRFVQTVVSGFYTPLPAGFE